MSQVYSHDTVKNSFGITPKNNRSFSTKILNKVTNSSKAIFLGLTAIFAMVGSAKFSSEPARSLPFFAGAIFFGTMRATSNSQMSLRKRVLISLEQGMLLGLGALSVAIDRGFVNKLSEAYSR